MSLTKEDKLGPVMRMYDLIVERVNDRVEYFMGRVLTIVDAAISDPEQRKGLKDLIKGVAWEKSWHITSIGQIIKQFAVKYTKVEIPEEVRYFLENGEWKKTCMTPRDSQNYFPD